MNKYGDTSRCVSIIDHGVALVHKETGQSMGQLLVSARQLLKLSGEEKMTFAGRLDELASGFCIVLWGQARFDKQKWLGLSKEYKVTFVLGVQSKSLDILSDTLQLDTKALQKEHSLKKVTQALQSLVGRWEVPFPPMSAYRIGGKPLWSHARSGVNPYPKPYTTLNILGVLDISIQKTTLQSLKNQAQGVCKNLGPNFNKEQISASWNSLATKHDQNQSLQTVTCVVQVTSGSYVRTFAAMAARRLKTIGCVSALTRTKIGTFN